MHYLFEKSDSLNTPVECFVFDTSVEDFPVRPHWHYFEEIIFMLEGSAEMHTGDGKYILDEGDMIIFHSKSVHSIFSAGSGQIRYAVLKFDINKFTTTSDYAPKLRSIFKYAEKTGMPCYFDRDTAEEMHCSEIFRSCIREIQEHRYGYDIMLRAHIYALLMSIVRRWMDLGMVISSKDFSVGAEETPDIDSVTEYIDSLMQDNIKVSEIAEKCGMSYSAFAKKFREIYGISCKEYIERMRIYKAEEFLLFTDYDMNYISQETGFSDCSHMIKSFKQIRGITPKQFRMNNRNGVVNAVKS